MPGGAWLGLILALAIAAPCAAGQGQAEFLGSFRLTDRVAYLGGLSGLELDAGGTSFAALSDSAALVSGDLRRDLSGAIIGISLDGAPVRLLDHAGRLLNPPRDDAEGLAYAGAGRFLISFELIHRVAIYAAAGEAVRTLPIPQKYFPGLHANAGLEGLAIGRDGAIYVLPEGDSAGSAWFPVFRFADGAWQEAFRLKGEKTFRPVGADFGPDGRLYILERDYWPLLGFRSRLRRVAVDGTGEEVLIETPTGLHANLEGLAIWRDDKGRLRATMVADNNFLPFSATEFVDYAIPD